MALSYWIETLLSLSNPPGSRTPGTLARQVGVEYLYPLIPPGLSTYFITTPQIAAQVRGFPMYMGIFYRIRFGYMVPGAFRLTLIAGGIVAYDGTLTGYTMEQGIDYLYFMEPQSSTVAYITNITSMNQRFQMISQYLIISSEEDYRTLKAYLEALQFPYKLPEI